MNVKTDQELLRAYVLEQSEAAFAELVRRHIHLVYSVALRLVVDPHLAEDATQGTFIALAQNARKLAVREVLSSWLHLTARNVASKLVRSEERRRAREKEAVAMELEAAEPEQLWNQVAPHLDEAIGFLSDRERDALMLRFFEQKSAREIGLVLGVSEEAAQRRVSRAVERLRGVLVKRGVTVGASGLVIALSAKAIQAAPTNLAGTVLSTIAAGTAVHTAASTAATKVIAMTTIQKAFIATVLVGALGTGIYQGRQLSIRAAEAQTLSQAQKALAEQLQQWQRQRDAATNRLAAANKQLSQLQSAQGTGELLKLRGQVGMLRRQLTAMETEAASRAAGYPKMQNDLATKEAMRQSRLTAFRSMYGPLFKELKLTPEQTEKAAQAIGEVVQTQIDKWFVLPQGSLSPAETAQAGAERETEWERQLQPILGEAGCARFREYQAGIPAQATVALLDGELGANQLSEDQKARLLQVVKAEPVDLTRGLYGDWDPAFWGPQEHIDNHLLQVAESNQRIAQQASGFLTPEQLVALSSVLSNGITARITMAAALIRKP